MAPDDAHGEEHKPLLLHHSRPSEDGAVPRLSSGGASIDVEQSPPTPAAAAAAADHAHAERTRAGGTAQLSLMGSYAMAAWAWRSWEFAVALLLIELYPDSLLMVSAYGIADNIVRVLLGSHVGKFIARHELLPAATTMYLIQNGCIGTSAACALALLKFQDFGLPQQAYWPLVVVMIVVGALSSVGSSGVRIAVEAEAVTVLAGGNSRWLSELNAGFRAIDLTCLLAAPMLVGVVMTWLQPAAATLLLSGYTLLAWIPELSLMRVAVACAPALGTYKKAAAAAVAAAAPAEHEDKDAEQASQQNGEQRQQQRQEHSGSRQESALRVYFRSPVLLPTLGLTFLYCTVLSLGFLMTSYLQWTGLTSAEVSLYRGVGAITGLAATAISPFLQRSVGLVASGMVGISLQLACLVLGAGPVILAGLLQPGGPGDLQPSAALVRCMVAGVVASRCGLWLYDLALTQLMQERIPQHELGIVCGVQSSLQAAFEMLAFWAGVALHDPRQFYLLQLGSVGMVASCFLLYAKFAIGEGCGRWTPVPRQETA